MLPSLLENEFNENPPEPSCSGLRNRTGRLILVNGDLLYPKLKESSIWKRKGPVVGLNTSDGPIFVCVERSHVTDTYVYDTETWDYTLIELVF